MKKQDSQKEELIKVVITYQMTRSQWDSAKNVTTIGMTKKDYEEIEEELKHNCWTMDMECESGKRVTELLKQLVKLQGYKKLCGWVIEVKKDGLEKLEEIKKLENSDFKEINSLWTTYTYRPEDEQQSYDCVKQHLKIFFEQSMYKQEADFGEPCKTCPRNIDCKKLDWLKIMEPILSQSQIPMTLWCQNDKER